MDEQITNNAVRPADYDDYLHLSLSEVSELINCHRISAGEYLSLNAVPYVCYARKRQYLWSDIKEFINSMRVIA